MTVEYRVGNDALTNAEIDANFKDALFRYGGTVASATTMSFTAGYNYFNVSGTTSITAFPDRVYTDSVYGSVVMLVFDGILTLTYDAAKLILCNGTSNITTAAGDKAIFIQKTAAIWECIAYQRRDGSPITASSSSMTLSGDLEVGGEAHFGTKETITSSTNPTIDWGAGNKQYIALAHNIGTGDLEMTDPSGACNVLLHVNNTGAYTIATDAYDPSGAGSVYWPAGVGPTITSSGQDIISFYFDGVDYYGSYLQAYA